MKQPDPVLAALRDTQGLGRTELEHVVGMYRKWLYLPDAGALLAVLAAVAANRVQGDPVWLVLVGPSGGGKTELLGGLGALDDVVQAATLTEASLLSGTSRKEQAASAKGGLLREIGDYGILALKDFGSVLSMHRDARAMLLAALREIYDGSWVRHVGTDGGKSMVWAGKVGLVAGCTPMIDKHHAVMASLGERFAMYRLPVEEADEHARRSLAHAGQEHRMRAELREAVSGFFARLDMPDAPPTYEKADQERLIALSTLVARARSAVDRDGHTREIELIPAAEAPGRLIGVLARMLTGLRAIGAGEETAWRLTVKVGLDSMPAQRLAVLEHLLTRGQMTTTQVATSLGYPTSTASRVLEDLAAHAVIRRYDHGQGKAHVWEIGEWAAQRFAHVHGTSPEMSEGGPSDLSRNVGRGEQTRIVEPQTPSLTFSDSTFDDISGEVPIEDEAA